MGQMGFLHDTEGVTESRFRNLVEGSLSLPGDLMGYSLQQRLVRAFPGKVVIEGAEGPAFNVPEFAEAGHCRVTYHPGVFAHTLHDWIGPKKGFRRHVVNALMEVEWQGHQIVVLVLTVSGDCGSSTRFFAVVPELETGEAFIDAVLVHTSTLRGEILVYDCGRFRKDRDLVKSIESASFDNLVLRAGLAESIRQDMEGFFGSRELYEGHGVPWKRGALLYGPPGNGKTHALKALINRLRKPTVYVKTLEQGDQGPSQESLRSIFHRARNAAPCVLVLEDLDSMIDDANRSYFLNEMDGFAENHGVLVLATTNHADRIDPAIVQRPSRFDRKYHFDLPGPAERVAYMQMWNRQRERGVRLADDDIRELAAATDAFSYAYLKELMLSVLIAHFGASDRTLRDVALEQAALLHAQMGPPGREHGDESASRGRRRPNRREEGGFDGDDG